jgi:hypothetical protein
LFKNNSSINLKLKAMFIEMSYLVFILLIIYFIVEIGVPVILNDRPYFWLTKSLFVGKKTNQKGMTLEEQIKDAGEAFETAKRKYETLNLSADKKSKSAMRELKKAEKTFKSSQKTLEGLNKTEIKK